MKNFLTSLIIAIALISYGVVDCYAAVRPNSKKGIYHCQGRDGEATGDLDTIDITGAGSPNAYDLIDGDSAIVVEISGTSGDVYIYVFDADGTDANDDPEVIRPNDYSSGGVWRLVEFHANGFTTISTPTPTLIMKDSDATDGDNNYSLGINATDTGSGTEDIDITERIQIAGVLTTIRFVNADGSYQVGTVSMPLYVVGSLELGHASDTTIARSGPGAITVEGSAVLLSGGALGTPASGTLTNCSGLPSSGITTIVDSVAWDAGGMTPDGTQCADAARVTINSGPVQYTIICADNDASTMYGHIVMPDSWDGGTVTFEGEYLQTAADTSALNSDVTMMCRGSGETVNSTWGTEVALDDAAVTGSNGVDHTTTAAITPNGTCAGGDTLYWRWQLDATGTTTAVATLHFLGAKIEYTSNVGD